MAYNFVDDKHLKGELKTKRVFCLVEAASDIFYLAAATILGFILLLSAQDNFARILAGMMALVLVCGDAFHLVPRIMVICTGKEEQLRGQLGRPTINGQKDIPLLVG